MILDDALKQFESSFTKVVAPLRHDKTVPLCWSGGLADFDKAAPVLYPTADRAIKAWLDTANSSTTCFAVLEWLQKPELMEYQITIADRMGRHRLVDNKFTVKSQFVVLSND